MVNVAVIGSGSIGQRHFRNITQLGASAEILSVRKHGIDGIKRVIRSNGFDGAVIATASEIRFELISYCLDYLPLVFVEKPIVCDLPSFYFFV